MTFQRKPPTRSEAPRHGEPLPPTRPTPVPAALAEPAANPELGTVAILGWSLGSLEAMLPADRRWLVVGPPDCADYAAANRVPFFGWDFEDFSPARAHALAVALKERGVDYTVPLFEPLVEWHGAVDAELRERPELAEWVQLFRNKAMMKRRAQLHDIPVGVFREADDREEANEFLDDINLALLSHQPVRPVHIKAFDEAGCKGHYRITSREDLDEVPDEAFPCLVESELEGQEIACEVWVHDGQIVFMNISEYVHLGHSVLMPPGPELEERREEIHEMNQRLVQAFGIRSGFIHPEWFLADNGAIHFGEVAYRVPGGNAFELIERAYGFSPYEAQVLVMDPTVDHETVRAFFPAEDEARGHAGVLLAYPDYADGEAVTEVALPQALVEDPAFESHDLMLPAECSVEQRNTFVNGTHWGNIYLFSDDPERIRRLCRKFEGFRFYR